MAQLGEETLRQLCKLRSAVLVASVVFCGLLERHSFTWAAGCESDPAAEARAFCSKLHKVKAIPFKKGDRVDDDVYNGLIRLGYEAVPCLTEAITNEKVMPDPRRAPLYHPVKVGDTAFWILVDITNLPYDEMFPEKLRKRFNEQGVYAYFDWVNRGGTS